MKIYIRKLEVLKVIEFEETKTAKKGASLLKLGIPQPLKLRIIGIPGRAWTVQPAVYRELTDKVNIGIKFLETIGAAFKFKKGNTLINGDDHTPMIKSMRSLLKQPALEETEENPDDEDLNSNDDGDLDSNHSEDRVYAMVKNMMTFLCMMSAKKMKK